MVLVDADSTNWMEAFLATAPDHSTSNSASVCSSEETIPGLDPFRTTVGAFTGSPKVERKLLTSEAAKLVRPTMAMDCPVPSMELLYSAATS